MLVLNELGLVCTHFRVHSSGIQPGELCYHVTQHKKQEEEAENLRCGRKWKSEGKMKWKTDHRRVSGKKME